MNFEFKKPAVCEEIKLVFKRAKLGVGEEEPKGFERNRHRRSRASWRRRSGKDGLRRLPSRRALSNQLANLTSLTHRTPSPSIHCTVLDLLDVCSLPLFCCCLPLRELYIFFVLAVPRPVPPTGRLRRLPCIFTSHPHPSCSGK